MKIFEFPVLEPLLFRHAEDAAFYWLQLDRATESVNIDFARLSHFDLLLNANLDGLRAAGDAGWRAAFASLQRWRKPGEAFVCAWLALRLDEAPLLERVIDVVNQCPDMMLRGVISAFARTRPDKLTRLLASCSVLAQLPLIHVARMRASVLVNASIDELNLCEHFSSDDAKVRAAACRMQGTKQEASKIVSLLDSALSDSDLTVRAEAAISISRFKNFNESNEVLLRCIQSQSALIDASSGWNRKQAARRLNRWVRHLAVALPLDSPVTKETMRMLSRRDALSFILWHGDTQNLPFVIEMMGYPDVNRYAGWVWQSMLGIDLLKHALTVPESSDDIDTVHQSAASRQDAANGLPAPSIPAIHAYIAADHAVPAEHQRVLLGRELSAKHALDVLQNSQQALRSIAASWLNHTQDKVFINVRAPAAQQRATIEALQQLASGKLAL